MTDPKLHLLHLSSPALPIGAYAYSQGLEFAIESGWVNGPALEAWLKDGLHLGVAQLDLPILLRARSALADTDMTQLNHWNDFLLANRETRELLLEDQQIGTALLRLLNSLSDEALPTLEQAPGYAIAFAIACEHWNIDADSALQSFCYSWLENQVTAATKLVPLGQTDAQRLLLRLLGGVAKACVIGRGLEDHALGLSLPGLALASCGHERQHTRLFRS